MQLTFQLTWFCLSFLPLNLESLLCQLCHTQHWIRDVCCHERHPNLSRRDAEVQLTNTVRSKWMSVGSHQFRKRQLMTHLSVCCKPGRTRRHSSATGDQQFDDFIWRSVDRAEAADRGFQNSSLDSFSRAVTTTVTVGRR